MSSEDSKKMIAFIHCEGCASGKTRFAKIEVSCKEAVELGFLRDECKSGCVGCGDCVKSCKLGAIKKLGNQIFIDRNICNGCGDCVKAGVCPQKLIRLIPADATNFIPCSSKCDDEDRVRALCNYGCIACGECERACPRGAVKIIDNHAVIDYSKCVGCSACTIKCKKKIIQDTYHDLTKLKTHVAFVRCSGGNRAFDKLEGRGYKDCKEALLNTNLEAEGLCTTTCLGQGSCTAVCRYGAITIVKGTAFVDIEKCVGCRDCTFVCPQHLIKIVPYKGMKQVPCSSKDDYEDKTKVCDSGCIGCEDCVNNCPNDAIYMEEAHAVIDPNNCINCNMCSYVCPRNVIKEQSVPEYIYVQRAILSGSDEDEGKGE